MKYEIESILLILDIALYISKLFSIYVVLFAIISSYAIKQEGGDDIRKALSKLA